MQSLVLSALTVSYHETSRRAERETGIKAAAITVWGELKEAYQSYERREKKEVGARWTDEEWRVARLLEEVRLNGTKLEF